MICRILLINFLLLSAPGVSSGVEYDVAINLLKARNPFEFGYKKAGARKKIKSIEKNEIAGMIMIRGDRKIAVINGKSYRVGDTFGKLPITSITLKYLELSSGKTTKRIYLK